ncbi:MAG: hypothetical protein Q9191_003705 [Dirinaria sp. TL-2023a]
MSSSNMNPSPTSATPTSPFRHRAASATGVFDNNNEIDIDAQNHDRMETDEESSEESSSEADTPPNDNTSVRVGPPDMMLVDQEAMDTAPDNLHAGEIRLPVGPANQEQYPDIPHDPPASQPIDNARGTDDEALIDLIQPPPLLSESDALLSGADSNPPAHLAGAAAVNGSQADTSIESHQSSANTNEGAQPGEQVAIEGNDHTNRAADENPTLIPSPPEANHNESSSEEEEQPYWAKFEEDKSAPTEEELKMIEQQPHEISALDHEHWEKLAFEPLDDPEYLPSSTGRISWTLKGFHGTPANPNRETVMRSPSVLIGDYYWSIKVFPRGNDGSPLMSVYIECSPYPNDDQTTEPPNDRQPNQDPKKALLGSLPKDSSTDDTSSSDTPRPSNSAAAPVREQGKGKQTADTAADGVPKPEVKWEVPAQILCVAYNPDEPRVNSFERGDHRFHHKTSDWGWRRFTGPWKVLHLRASNQRQALLRNDTLSFTAYIRTVKDTTGALWWHAPTGEPQWDHYERLGLNRLLSKDVGSSAAVSALSTWLHLYPFCGSLKRLQEAQEKDRRDRPLFDDLEFYRKELIATSQDAEHDIDFHNSVEYIEWYDAVQCEADVIAFWDILRRALSSEASGVKPMSKAKDFFKDILMLKQPDAGKQAHATSDQVVPPPKGTEPCSVQEAVDLAMTYEKEEDRVWKTFDGLNQSLTEPPSVLQIELRRQMYDTKARKWKKSTHQIKLDEIVSLAPPTLSSRYEYSLLGIVVHSGSLESKDYYSVLRPEGPGTRWIKYAGDKAERGVECLTTKQALEAHEGGPDAENTSAVAYIATYVRTALFSKFGKTPKCEPAVSDIVSTGPQKKGDATIQPMEEDEDGVPIPLHVYQSELFEGHNDLGVFDWSKHSDADSRILKLEINDNASISAIVDTVVNARREKFPDRQEKYGMWFVNTFMNNPAMENVLRAPDVLPMDAFTADELLRSTNVCYDVVRIWLHTFPSETEGKHHPNTEATGEPTRAPISDVDEVMQIEGEGGTVTANERPAHPRDQVEMSSMEQAAPGSVIENTATQAATARDGDTPMEGNAEAEAEDVAPPSPLPPITKSKWNPKLDMDFLKNDDNIYIFLKVFEPKGQIFRGVKAFFVKQNALVGEELKKALSLSKDQAIDVWEEKITAHVTPISTDSRFADVAPRSGVILIAQRRQSESELSQLKEAGKPATVPEYRDYLFCATDPAYLKPTLTASYFSTPYYSCSIAYGRPHGAGTSISLAGDSYTGNFSSGLKSGQGTMRYSNGDIYTGAWADNEPEGQGEMTYAKTGNVYTGGFRKRKRHGKGVMKFEVADEEQRLCQICYENEMDAVFYDCGHVTACETCARQVDDCPVCRRKVKAVIRIWLSA